MYMHTGNSCEHGHERGLLGGVCTHARTPSDHGGATGDGSGAHDLEMRGGRRRMVVCACVGIYLVLGKCFWVLCAVRSCG